MPQSPEHDSVDDRWTFLAPWTALLARHAVRIKTKGDCDHSCRREFEAITLTMQASVMEDEEPYETLQQTAQAVHLVAAALRLHPDAWAAVLVGQCGCKNYFNPRHEALKPRFEFYCGLYPGQVLMDKAGLRFFRVLMEPTARTAAFHDAMQQLLLLPAPLRVHTPPVGIKIHVSTWNEVNNILLDLTAFACALKHVNDCQTPSAAWCDLEAVVFDLTGLEFTSGHVQRVLQLASASPFVQFSRLTIDPKEVSCNEEELRTLFRSLMAASPDMDVDLGDVTWGYNRQFDADGSDSSSDPKIALVMRAIAAAPVAIKYLNVGQLMTRARNESDRRQVVWGHLFGTLLHPLAVCRIQNLALSSSRVLHVESDADFIREASSAWPGFHVPDSLTLDVRNGNQSSLCAIIGAFASDLRHLSISDTKRLIPSTTVASILKACVRLESLGLNNVELASMNVFYANPRNPHRRLTTLGLANVMLRDASSMPTFMRELADPQSPLGRTLSEFSLVRSGDPADVRDKLVLRHPDLVLQAQQVLRLNGRVHTLHVDVEDHTPRQLMRELVQAHRRPAAVPLAPLALASKLAFLGALRQSPGPASRHALCDDVVRHIFEYAAVSLPRWVCIKTSTTS